MTLGILTFSGYPRICSQLSSPTPISIVDFAPRTNIFIASRSDGRARRDRLCNAERDAGGRHDAGPQTRLRVGGSFKRRGRGQTPATRADGPSACPGDSSPERGHVSESDAPGTWSKL